MNDPTPDQTNRLAVFVSHILHPYVLPVPTVLILLSGLPLKEALGWTVIVVAIILLPGMTYAAYLQQHGQLLHRRQTRGPLYLVGWVSVVVALDIMLAFQAPLVLTASVATLAVWVPLQWAVNQWMTKLSAHAAVAAGCFTALLILGKLPTVWTQVGLFVLILLILWARIVTRNHTLLQVILGVLVGVLPVLLVFPLVLA